MIMDTDKRSVRWPPSYDADSLARTITDLISTERFVTQFYERFSHSGKFYQGDIVSLSAQIPFLGGNVDEVTGTLGIVAKVTDDTYKYWMVLSNSCDLSRSSCEPSFAIIVPLENLGESDDISSETRRALRHYEVYKQFYTPPFSSIGLKKYFVADFTRPVLIERDILFRSASVVARLQKYSWYLLNCCLVRFLARDDGRLDPD